MIVRLCPSPLTWVPGAPLTYFNDGGVRRIFLGLTFGQKGFFWVYERPRDFLELQKQHRDFFEYCILHQLKSTITKAQFTACVVLQDIFEIVIYLF